MHVHGRSDPVFIVIFAMDFFSGLSFGCFDYPSTPILRISWITASYGVDFHFHTSELHGFGHNIAMKLGGGNYKI